jgi:type II protein arginine methyltransferase
MKAVLQVSELLGSCGDNELSPECLATASHLLQPAGACIPQCYTSYFAPVAAHAVHAALVAMGKPERLEMPMVVKLLRHAAHAPPQPAFTFEHPSECAVCSTSAT